MQKVVSKVWRPTPLPLAFHLTLDRGEWEKALKIYQAHPYHAPPIDTYELLKMIMHKTHTSAGEVKQRFENKLKAFVVLRRRAAEPVEWGAFWNAINEGDSKMISMGLSGARIYGVKCQTGVAEACAVLVKSLGSRWKRVLVDEIPFGTVSKNNLLTVALETSKPDIAIEILQNSRVCRADIANLWPLVNKFDYRVGLQFIGHCPKTAVPFDVVIPNLLNKGCELNTLSEQLEQQKCLSDVAVVAPLLEHAVSIQSWEYVHRGIDHLLDIGVISDACHRVFCHLCKTRSTKDVVKSLRAAGVSLHTMTVDALEDITLGR